MPYSRPSLTELRNQAMQDVTASDLPNADGLLRKSVLRVLAWVQAGLAHLHYGYLDWIARQAVPFTAVGEFLEGWAGLKGVARKPARQAAGTITFTGTNGASIPAGTRVVRSDGVGFTVATGVTVSGGAATVAISADTAGSGGNFDNGTRFTLGSSIAGVQSQSSASVQTIAGGDVEQDDPFRTRMLQVYAAPPQGGDRNDYIQWALAVPGVTRAWIKPNAMGPGTVSVWVMLDEAEAAHDGFPQGDNGVAANEPRDVAATGDQLVVADALYALQPVTALVYLLKPIPAPISFTVSDLGAQNTPAMQVAIAAALRDMLLRLATVGGTVDQDAGAPWPPLEPSDWYAAVEAIPGLNKFRISPPATALSAPPGHLFTVGALTFSSDVVPDPGAITISISDAVLTDSPPASEPGVLLSVSSLTFDSEVIGVTSDPQTITVTNNGDVDLVISGVTVTGDFTITGMTSP